MRKLLTSAFLALGMCSADPVAAQEPKQSTGFVFSFISCPNDVEHITQCKAYIHQVWYKTKEVCEVDNAIAFQQYLEINDMYSVFHSCNRITIDLPEGDRL